MKLLRGIRGRVTFGVLAITAVVYSLLGTVGFIQIADGGRAAITERVEQVLDDLEVAVRAKTGTVNLATADGVSAVVSDPAAPPTRRDGQIVVERRLEVDGGGVLLVGTSSEAPLTDSLRSLYRALWFAIPLAALLSALLAGLATDRALRPVEQITDLAATIGNDPDGRRVREPASGDEVERLAVTVNEMLERIERGRAAQRQFTSDAAHELRTPLMALLGELELSRPALALIDPDLPDRLDGIAGRLEQRIADLVYLSTLDEAPPLVLRPTSLWALVEAEIRATAPEAVLMPTSAEGAEDVILTIDGEAVSRALRNLLTNARRHARSTVAVALEVTADRVWVHVDDDGPGVAPEHRDDLFGRFARLDEARAMDGGGSGLGLAIVASVTAAHRGGALVTESPLGGARLSLWLPRDATDRADDRSVGQLG